MTIRFTLPFLPKSKSNGYKAGKAGWFKPAAILAQETAIRQTALISLPIGFQPSKKAWSVDCTFFYADRRRRDLDGHLKLLLDALNGIVWVDDSQILEINIRKVLGYQIEGTEVTLCEI